MALTIHGPLGAVVHYAGEGLHEAGHLTHFRDQTPPVYPAPQGLVDYLVAQGRALDPRDPRGALALASMLIPGRAGRAPAVAMKADLPTLQAGAGIRAPDSAANFYGRATASDAPAWIQGEIGPRRVGGVYRSGYWGEDYRVLDIRHGSGRAGSLWQIKVEPVDPHAPYNFGARWHSTRWDPRRDKVLSQPPASPAATEYMGSLLGTRYDPNIHKPGAG